MSEPRPIGWPARVAIVAVLGMLLVAVALGCRAVLGLPAGTGAAEPLRVPVEAVATPVALVVLAGLALLVAVLRPVRRRRRDPERPDWVYEPPPAAWYEKALPLLVLLLIGGVAVFGAWLLVVRGTSPAQTTPTQRQTAPPSVPAPAPAAPAAPAPAAAPEAPWLWAAAGVVALAAAAGLLATRAAVRRRRSPAVRTAPGAGRLADLLEGSLEDLRAEPDPRQGVLAAYARMERILTPRGVGRQRHETVMEYLDRLLGRPRSLMWICGQVRGGQWS